MACETKLLEKIEENTRKLIAPDRPVTQGRQENWNYFKVGRYIEYQRKVTLTGSAENFDILFGVPVQLNRIDIFANDATAKSFDVRMFSGIVNTSAYGILVSFTADTNQSLVVQLGKEYQYIQLPIRLRFAISASTAGKVLTFRILAEEL